jgi:hypothetical protein
MVPTGEIVSRVRLGACQGAATINLIRETNPDLKFSISAIPADDGYDG